MSKSTWYKIAYSFRVVYTKRIIVKHHPCIILSKWYVDCIFLQVTYSQYPIQSRLEVMLAWSEELWSAYPASVPKFSFLFHSEYSHDLVNHLQLADIHLTKYLKRFKERLVFWLVFCFFCFFFGWTIHSSGWVSGGVYLRAWVRVRVRFRMNSKVRQRLC